MSQILQVRQHVCDAQNFLTSPDAKIKSTIAFSNRFFVGKHPTYLSMTLTQSETKALVKIMILPLVQGLTGSLNREDEKPP